MSIKYRIYKFAEFEMDEEEATLLKSSRDVELTATEFSILLALIRKRGKSISTANLFEEVWGLESAAQENNVPAHIKGIRNKFAEPDREKFIKTEKNKKGYKFHFEPVIEELKQQEEYKFVDGSQNEDQVAADVSAPEMVLPEVPGTESEGQPQTFTTRQIIFAGFGLLSAYLFFEFGRRFWLCEIDECFEQKVFIALATVCYGILTGIGVLLECAYDFDRYGWNSAKMIPSIVLANAGAMFAALTVAGHLLQDDGVYAFGTGLMFLAAGAIISCALAALVLPNAPVTVARFQTQSAIGAFCKNVVVYFLPLYMVFGLLIFCLVFGASELTKNIAFPISFGVVWMIFFVFSYLSTNYLSDNLLTEKDGRKYPYHGLFSLLLQLRMIFCFIAALGSVIYYFVRILM